MKTKSNMTVKDKEKKIKQCKHSFIPKFWEYETWDNENGSLRSKELTQVICKKCFFIKYLKYL